MQCNGHLCPQVFEEDPILTQQVRERYLVEDVPHPLFQRLPQAAQNTAVVVDAQADDLRPGVLDAIARLVEQRLAQDE